MSTTLPLSSRLETIAALSQWHASATHERIEFVFSVDDGVLNGPFFYGSDGVRTSTLAPSLKAFATMLEKTLAQLLGEGYLPESYYVKVVSEAGAPVRVTEVDSSAFVQGHAPVIAADFKAKTVEAGRLHPPTPISGEDEDANAVAEDSAVRNDALLMRKLLLQRGHGTGYSMVELDAEQQRRGLEFPPELRFYYALVREGEVAEVEGKPVFAADLQAGTGESDNVVDDALRAGGSEIPPMPAPAETDAVRPLFTAREWIVFARNDAGNQFALDIAPGPAGRAGQVVEFTHGELTPPRLVARSLTEFINGELVSAQARAASWQGAGDVSDVDAQYGNVAVFADGVTPSAQHLKESTVIEIQQLSIPFDLEQLTPLTHLKELRFTQHHDYQLANTSAAKNLSITSLTAPLGVWTVLVEDDNLPKHLNIAQFTTANALTAEQGEVVNRVLTQFGTKPLSVNEWETEASAATPKGVPAEGKGAASEDAVAEPASVAPAESAEPVESSTQREPEALTAESAESAEPTESSKEQGEDIVIQTSELSPATQPTPLIADDDTPRIDVAEGTEEWKTSAEIETDSRFLVEAEMPHTLAPSKGDFESASSFFISTEPGSVGGATPAVSEDDATREARAYLEQISGVYDEAAERAETTEPREEYRSQVEALAMLRDESTPPASESKGEIIIEEQEVMEDERGKSVADFKLDEVAQRQESEETRSGFVDQHRGERGSDEGGFRSALKRWFG
ncbi:SMI1/KNR4 family protein [Rothia sp. ZJ1223]|uniref:SMI1/KNR4 family protein n=1 Tax=Rothia sp. ZJ1223 TaxID=2811098 RepID=UPI0019571371|nr:SMI1/KNR4 family protein [Rothia sp. ZJ1223]MBM7051742.1 SMI1/KNR4 family protein [Rothia sp. ZJ1223]